MNGNAKKIAQNLSYAFLAQGISLGISILISFVLPKFIGVTAFGYWQLFIFYTTYAGFFHLGLTDGIYLRIGGKQFSDLNYSMLGTEMRYLNIFQGSIALIVIVIAFNLDLNPDRLFVIVSFFIYMVTFNAVAYLGYIFQAVNQTKDYSTAIIIEKTCCFLTMIFLIFFQIKDFRPYIIVYLLCDIFALVYCIWKGRKIVFAPGTIHTTVWKELFTNIKIGSKLLVANLASLLIIGFNRMLIDRHWGIEMFGKFSMAISLTNFFLLFIMQISMVLFPVLRQTEDKHIQKIYITIRKILFLILPIIFVLYFPLQFLLEAWLPQYAESFRYLILLLPICVYDGRMQLLCTTYFKVLRKEKNLLFVNVVTMLASSLLGLLGTYVFNNVYFVIMVIVFSVIMRNVMSEVYLGKIMKISIMKDLILEGVLVGCFWLLAWLVNAWYSFIIYILFYLLYIVVKRRDVKPLKQFICRK